MANPNFDQLLPSSEGLKHDPAVHLSKAGEAFKIGSYDEAIANCDRALECDPGLAEAYYIRGTCNFTMKAFTKALDDYTEALRRSRNIARYHVALGTTSDQVGDYETAIAAFKLAIALEPDYSLGYVSMANILATCPVDSVRNGDQALAHAQKACALSPQDWRSFSVLAAAYAELGQFFPAVEAATRALELAPEPEKRERRERIELYRSGIPFRAKAIERM